MKTKKTVNENDKRMPFLSTNTFVMNPMLQQYFTIKKKYKDAVLLLRVGDFYETCNDDAEILARQVEIPLVVCTQNPEVKTAASMPHSALHTALHTALHKLTKAGYKVAICEQLEAPKPEPIRRGVTGLFPNG